MAGFKVSKIFFLFKKYGGFRRLAAYVRLGLLGRVMGECAKGILKRKTLAEIYDASQDHVVAALQKKYKPLLLDRLAFYENQFLTPDLAESHGGTRQRAEVIWFCWLQGVEEAPPIIKICLASLKKYLPGKEIRLVDDSNRRQYVTLPDYIEKKWAKKQIPPALFADLLRLELLILYGGTWLDPTVLCTGNNLVTKCLDADLFLYQYRKSPDGPYAGISNWFITSCANHPMLMALRDGLLAYWKDFDFVLEYFVFHRFFDLLAEERPRLMAAMPYAYSSDALALGHHWDKPFKKEMWEKWVSNVAFHKLTYKVDETVKNTPSNYYHHILEMYKEL